MRNRLHDAGLRARRPAIRVPLTRRHIQERLDFAHLHLHWTIADWEPVLFTDESRFCIDFTDRRARVWRLPTEIFHPDSVAEHNRYGGGSIMVWGGISLRGRTELRVINNGTRTAQRYRDEILDVHMRPYAGAIGPDFLLMDDNATVHRARIVQEYLQKERIERMDWPARSPDLNPIHCVCVCCKLQYRPVLFNHKVSWSSEQLLWLNGHT